MGYQLERIHSIYQDMCANDGACHVDMDSVHGMREAQEAGAFEGRFFRGSSLLNYVSCLNLTLWI